MLRHVEAEQRPEIGLGEPRLGPLESLLAQPVERERAPPSRRHRPVCVNRAILDPPQSFAESVPSGPRSGAPALDARRSLRLVSCKRLQEPVSATTIRSAPIMGERWRTGHGRGSAGLDRHRADGLQPRQPPARGRPRRRGLQPHPGEGRAPGEIGGEVVDSPARARRLRDRLHHGRRTRRLQGGRARARRGCSASGPRPRIIVDSTTVSPEASAEVRAQAAERDVALLAAPVSGNPKVVDAGLLTFAVSGPEPPTARSSRYLDCSATGPPTSARASSPGWRRSATTCCSAWSPSRWPRSPCSPRRAGSPRADLLEFINRSVMGSMFTRYKTPALREPRLLADLHPGPAAQGLRPRLRGRARAQRCRCRSPPPRASWSRR